MMKIPWIFIVFFNSIYILCESGLSMFYVKLKMMIGKICQVLCFGSFSMIPFHYVSAL
jgi:hypothetical protein